MRLPAKKLAAAAILLLAVNPARATERTDNVTSSPKLPTMAQVHAVVAARLQALPGYKPGDLLVASDVLPILQELEQAGWKDLSRSELASRLIEDGEFLARELRSMPGRAFLRRVGREKLVYDRLDRLSRMPGGHQMIHDLVRLPDGHRYAAANPPRGVPSMTDFLPKGASGKKPRVPDLDQPTGRIYTETHLNEQLAAMHREMTSKPAGQ